MGGRGGGGAGRRTRRPWAAEFGVRRFLVRLRRGRSRGLGEKLRGQWHLIGRVVRVGCELFLVGSSEFVKV